MPTLFFEQSSFGQELILQNLHQLADKSFYDVCIVQKLGEYMQIPVRQHADYPALDAAHCLQWRTMSSSFREQLIKLTLHVLQMQQNPGTQLVTALVHIAEGNAK